MRVNLSIGKDGCFVCSFVGADFAVNMVSEVRFSIKTLHVKTSNVNERQLVNQVIRS